MGTTCKENGKISKEEMIELVVRIEKSAGEVVGNKFACASLLSDIRQVPLELNLLSALQMSNPNIQSIFVRLYARLHVAFNFINSHSDARLLKKVRKQSDYTLIFGEISRGIAKDLELLATFRSMIVVQTVRKLDSYFCDKGGWIESHSFYASHGVKPPFISPSSSSSSSSSSHSSHSSSSSSPPSSHSPSPS